MGYAAERFDNDNLEYDLEDNEFFVVCVERDGALCKYVTAAPSHIDALYNVEKETGLTADSGWDIFGPLIVC